MDGSIRLTAEERKGLLQVYRSGARPGRRAHIILLLADGFSVRDVRQVTYASFDLVIDAARRFRAGGARSVVEAGRASGGVPAWLLLVARWVATTTPADFGYFRTRWSC